MVSFKPFISESYGEFKTVGPFRSVRERTLYAHALKCIDRRRIIMRILLNYRTCVFQTATIGAPVCSAK